MGFLWGPQVHSGKRRAGVQVWVPLLGACPRCVFCDSQRVTQAAGNNAPGPEAS